MKVLKFVVIAIGLAFAGLIAYTLYHVFASAHAAAVMTHALSKTKAANTALLTYIADYDERFPNATSMPSHRGMLARYISQPEAFQGDGNEIDPVTFNFNLAGVGFARSGDLTLADGGSLPYIDAITYVATFRHNGHTCCSYGTADGGARNKHFDTAFDPSFIFDPQFDRTGIKLAPAAYLADQDPLRERP